MFPYEKYKQRANYIFGIINSVAQYRFWSLIVTILMEVLLKGLLHKMSNNRQIQNVKV
jgi:hypothetical protein